MGELNFNIFNLIIFAGIIQGLIFSFVVLVLKKYRSKANVFIALTVLVLSLSNLQYWFMDIEIKGTFAIFNNLRIPCDTLIVPFFFLYVNSYLQKKIEVKLVILLSVPFAVSLIFNIFIFYGFLIDRSYYRNINIALESLSFVFNLILIIVIILNISKYEKGNSQYDKTKIKSQTKWLKQILYIGIVMCLFWFGEIIYMQTKYNTTLSIYYPLWISISFLVYWISYVALFHSKIYNERRMLRGSTFIQNKTQTVSIQKRNVVLYNDIFSWIIDEKVYLNPNLSLSDVAVQFDVSKGYLSQILNSYSQLNFNDLINKHRVEEAKRMLANSEFDNYTILSVGFESGFNSKSSFYTAFKKFTNKTPVAFKKDVRNN